MSSTSTGAQSILDPRPILDRCIATGGAVIAGVRPDQLALPTPCPEMDVRALLGHLVAVLGRIAALGDGEDPFSVTETHGSGDSWSDAWAASGARAAGAWRDGSALDRAMALPWIQGTGAEVLTSYFSELTVHTWDLATATGQQPDWDDTVVTAALEARPILPAENRRELFEQISAAMGLDEVGIPFAEAVTVPADAPAIDRLVAWNGRDPRAVTIGHRARGWRRAPGS
ncbi:TIGR03086 family metal-binding protein [soil metagenome]